MIHAQTAQFRKSLILAPAAWAITLAASILPEILADQFGGVTLPWLVPVRIVVFAVLFAAGMVLEPVRPLRGFAAVWLVLYAGSNLVARFDFSLPLVQAWLGSSPFVRELQPSQFGKFAVAVAIILSLLALGYGRRRLYLTPGKLDAPITPVRWMGFPKPDPWWWFGGQYGIYIALAMAAAAWWISRPSPEMWARVVPALPGILLFAAMNAFYEESTFRAAMLATLEPVTGTRQAWAMSALYFGIAHFYGVPYGWVGILLASFNGWLLGKAMLETRGMFWAWWMHFLQDIAIFIFLAMGAVTPGG